VSGQRLRADASDFLVMGKGEVQGPVTDGFAETRRHDASARR
jgi:hypothetical protein